MKKGFDFWISKRVSSFLRKYWIIYCTCYLSAVWLAIAMRNPFVFLIVGFLPCPILWVYRSVHDPLYDLEESMERIDSGLCGLLLEHGSKLSKLRIATGERKYRQSCLFLALMTWPESNVDQRIVKFVENNKKINHSGTVGLSIWFFTFLILVFLAFFLG